jgi:hypothetical protein
MHAGNDNRIICSLSLYAILLVMHSVRRYTAGPFFIHPLIVTSSLVLRRISSQGASFRHGMAAAICNKQEISSEFPAGSRC